MHNYLHARLESPAFGLGFEKLNRQRSGSPNLFLDSLKDRMDNVIYTARSRELISIIETIKPRFVFLDVLSSTDFIAIYNCLEKFDTKVAILSPMLSTYSSPLNPDISSELKPEQKAKLMAEYLCNRLRTAFERLTDNIIHAGFSKRRMIVKMFRANGIPDNMHISNDNVRTTLYKSVPEFILAPFEMEYPSIRKKRNQYYIGPLIDQQRHSIFGSEAFNKVMEEAEACRNADKKIIFCSFGWMYDKWNAIIHAFINRLCNAVATKSNWLLVISFQDNGRIDRESLPGNVRLFGRLPQLEMLRISDVFVTHAGMGSVKESIQAGVPMLAYPFTKEWDSNGTASKIEYHGLGLRGNIRLDTIDLIRKKIEAVINCKQTKRQVEEFKKVVDSKYTSKSFLEIVDTVLTNSASLKE